MKPFSKEEFNVQQVDVATLTPKELAGELFDMSLFIQVAGNVNTSRLVAVLEAAAHYLE